jgi:hypothetical protein
MALFLLRTVKAIFESRLVLQNGMPNMMQQTLKNEICVQGLGLHMGRELTVRLKPAPVST